MAASEFAFNFMAVQDDAPAPISTTDDTFEKVKFRWIQNVSDLLVERAKEELIFTEVDVQGDVSGESDPLRLVDLSQSSYRQAGCVDEVWNASDIQRGVYEGGRKVWECTRDLIQFLAEQKHQFPIANSSKPPNPFHVLELGCGHGLPGCYLLRELSKQNINAFFSFSDYNDFVLLDATVSNIVLNLQPGRLSDSGEEVSIVAAMEKVGKQVLLGAGDWLSMSKVLLGDSSEDNGHACSDRNSGLPSDGTFDLILAAETMYTEDSARETALLIRRHLKPITGIAYVATKRYYFGVGGGVDSFRRYSMASENDNFPELSIETVRVFDNGSGNIREVLKICAMRP